MKQTMKLFSLIMLWFACQAVYSQTGDSKSEIRAFEKNNKPLLKSLNKQYDAKVDVEQRPNGRFYIKMLVENESGNTGNAAAESIANGITNLLFGK